MHKYLGLEKDGNLFSAPYEEEFIVEYQKNWSTTMSKMYFQSETIDMGHKLRPRLVFWGYLCGKGNFDINDDKLTDIAQIAVCMEMIHKASLLLDDFIDKDTTRHSKPAFYIEHGPEKTMMYSLNMLSNALDIINNIFSKDGGNESFYYKGMKEIINTLKEMSWGVLEELDLTSNSIIKIEKIQNIMNYETSSLITNSLLMGYYLTHYENNDVENILKSVGKDLGYIFQILNDMESFFSKNVNDHKGSINNDINRLRKNICIPVLYSTLSSFEKRKYKFDNTIDQTTIVNLLNKHKIKDVLFEEIFNVTNRIIANLQNNRSVLNPTWLEEFIEFIDSVLFVFKNRLD